MNGMAMNPGMVGYPTPAGHQADLNYIMGMVDQLSAIHRQNEATTTGILDKIGQVQKKAASLQFSNDEIIGLASETFKNDTKNLEAELSRLQKELKEVEKDRDENWKLVMHGCGILADIRDKMHEFKSRTETDILAWHKSYRNQLAFEREQNLQLNNTINEMRASACRANGYLREMRRCITDNPEWHELRVQNAQFRQERRMWKRMALPLMPHDDSDFSDDDDLRNSKLQKLSEQTKTCNENLEESDA
ncbi:hypothetical protein BJ878DRAFT_427525 [Calycina marina]|uniref:Uncharacterized protein n=1 Tax=Calycina marina TaxID=1763456 RepID=A0A9P7YYQ3_9HELO|nr:hypothetical protein BJ878DRAFT_427525 [Calycina marina]